MQTDGHECEETTVVELLNDLDRSVLEHICSSIKPPENRYGLLLTQYSRASAPGVVVSEVENVEHDDLRDLHNQIATLSTPQIQRGSRSSAAGPTASYAHIQLQSQTTDSADIIYKVQFKRAYRYYESLPPLRRDYSIGDFVIVVSDHGGQDLGVVVEVSTRGYLASTRRKDQELTLEYRFNGKVGVILHAATPRDRSQLRNRYHDEDILYQHCVAFQQNASNLKPLSIVDVEYQFDRTKVFVHYATTMRVDYRELVRSVQAICRCHVKMMRVNDKYHFVPRDFAAAALATGFVHM